MGLLDEAIRDHLELKRQRGADPNQVAREEQDALGPAVRRPVEGDAPAEAAEAAPDAEPPEAAPPEAAPPSAEVPEVAAPPEAHVEEHPVEQHAVPPPEAVDVEPAAPAEE